MCFLLIGDSPGERRPIGGTCPCTGEGDPDIEGENEGDIFGLETF